MKRVLAVMVLLIAAGVAWAAMAGSTDTHVRDEQGWPLTPGTVVAQLVRGPDGQCRPEPGADLGVSGRAKPGEAGSVTLAVDQATCRLVVAAVNEAPPVDPPSESVSGGGRR